MFAKKKRLQGKVEHVKMDKTAKVTVSVKVRHPKYHKIVPRKKVYLAHCEIEVKPGDVVEIIESKPYSKNKRWKVNKILENVTE
jgi:small subunit ribosomal protein S17